MVEEEKKTLASLYAGPTPEDARAVELLHPLIDGIASVWAETYQETGDSDLLFVIDFHADTASIGPRPAFLAANPELPPKVKEALSAPAKPAEGFQAALFVLFCTPDGTETGYTRLSVMPKPKADA